VSRILLVSADVIGPKMAGPGIRAWEFARRLALEHDVTVAAPPPIKVPEAGFKLVEAVRSVIDQEVEHADALVIQGSALDLFPSLRRTEVPLVVDLYDPYILENLEIHAQQPMTSRLMIHDQDLAVLRQQITAGDFFLCASERQRYLWLGMLAALNRVNPLTYAQDPTLRHMLAVVPFGLPDLPLRPGGKAIRGVLPGVGDDDVVMLWGGGIWDWFDPLTLIEAVARVVPDHPELKLVFMGTTHPNVSVPKPGMAARAAALSDSLGLTDRHVFFCGGWVPYEERQNFLAEADIGVSLHLHHLETTFSFRTRILDYLWAGLPMLLTSGDSMAELAEQEGLGVVVAPQAVDQAVDGILRLVEDGAYRESCGRAVREVATRFTWSEVCRPLLDFCRAPYRSPDAARRVAAANPGLGARQPGRELLLRKAWLSVRRDGVRPFASRTYRYLRRRLT
jgi:glycosyltransferase involved in cell wall biosynthesis